MPVDVESRCPFVSEVEQVSLAAQEEWEETAPMTNERHLADFRKARFPATDVLVAQEAGRQSRGLLAES